MTALIIGLGRSVTAEDAARMKARLAEVLPGVDAVIISDCTALAVVPGAGDTPSSTSLEVEVQSA